MFYLQLVGGFGIVTAEVVKMLDSLQGVSMAAFLSVSGFMGLNLCINLSNYRLRKSPPLRKAVLLYGIWTAVSISEIVLVVRLGYRWSWNDSIGLGLAACGMASAIRHRGDAVLRMRDIAISLKCIPITAAAIKILMLGGAAGIPLLGILLGHGNIQIRLWLLQFAAEKTGWDHAARATRMTERLNQATWTFFSLAWAFVHVF